MNISNYLKTHTLLCDGAMGTYYAASYHDDALAEQQNFDAPERIREIHLAYLRSGARLIRTNTFATNSNFFDNIGIAVNNVLVASQIAKKAIASYVEESGRNQEEDPIFLAADIGPIYNIANRDEEEVLAEYTQLIDAFLASGIHIFWLETQPDTQYLSRIADYIKAHCADAYVVATFSMDMTAYTKSGLSFAQIVRTVDALSTVDAYGLNCAMDAAHMYQLLSDVRFPSDKPFVALPNAGYPYQLRGKTIYGRNESYFQKMILAIADLGIDIVGGCCGTDPAYFAPIAEQIVSAPKKAKRTGTWNNPAAARTESEFWKKLQRGEKPFVVELDPPFDLSVEKLFDGAHLLKEHDVDLLTLSDSPMARGRMDPSLVGAKIQRETGIYVMPHMTCRDRNVIALRGTLLGDYINELKHFLIITGDPVATGDRATVTQVFDYNSIKFMDMVQKMNEDQFADDRVVYGGALNYHGVGVDAIARRMKLKMEKGCSFFLTQPIYSDEDIARIEDLRERTGAKIIGGIMPLVSRKNALFIANEMPGISVPQEIIDAYEEGMSREAYEAVAIETSLSIARKLSDVVDGYYFMTPFNRVGLICDIIERIREEM